MWSRFMPLVSIALVASLILLARATTPLAVGTGLLAAALGLSVWGTWRRGTWRRRARLGGDGQLDSGPTTARTGIQALARAIDARDGRPPDHATRIQVYAAGLARAMELPAAEVEGIRLAALVRDIGKLAVPVHVLSRVEPLAPDELAAVKIHPAVSAELISGLDTAFPLSAVVRGHHERWDGMGDPDGLRGNRYPPGLANRGTD